jgi:hypothetical protein
VTKPGPGMVVDAQGDVAGGRRKGRPGADIVLVAVDAHASWSGGAYGVLYLDTEIVGPVPDAAGHGTRFGWDIDTDADGSADFSLTVDGDLGVLQAAATGDVIAAGEILEPATYDESSSASVPLELIGQPATVRVRAATTGYRSGAAAGTDQAPEEGWIDVPWLDGEPALSDPSVEPEAGGPAAAYLAAATTFDAAYAALRALPREGDLALGVADMPALERLLDAAMADLDGAVTIPEVLALRDELRKVSNTAESMERNTAANLVFIVPWAMANEVGPLADAARAALGLPPRRDGDAI